jgi:RNA polymerase sigma factor (sigma-70 family)
MPDDQNLADRSCAEKNDDPEDRKAALEEFYERFKGLIYYHVIRTVASRRPGRVSDKEFIDDIFHCVLLKLLEKDICRFDSRGGTRSLATFVNFYAPRRAIDCLREEFSGNLREEIDESDTSIPPDVPPERIELINALADCVERALGDRERMFYALWVAGCSIEEIAKLLGIPSRNAADQEWHRIKQKLRKCLEEKGFSKEDVSEAFD